MLARPWLLLVVTPLLCGLGGCGITVPQIGEAWDQDFHDTHSDKPKPLKVTGSGQIEFEIRKRVYCDLKRAVQEAQEHGAKVDDGKGHVRKSKLIPEDWIAQVSLSSEVDELSALNPGVAFNTPLHTAITHFTGEGAPAAGVPVTYGATYPFLATPQSYGLGLGGTLSSTATRIDKFDPFYTIKSLSSPIDKQSVCATYEAEDNSNDPFVMQHFKPAKSSPLILSDLGITDWLIDAMVNNWSLYQERIPARRRPLHFGSKEKATGSKASRRPRLRRSWPPRRLAVLAGEAGMERSPTRFRWRSNSSS